MQIAELKSIEELNDERFSEIWLLSKLSEEAGVRKEARKALMRTRPEHSDALNAVFKRSLGDDPGFSRQLSTIDLPNPLRTALALKANKTHERSSDRRGHHYLCAQGGALALNALERSRFRGEGESRLILSGFQDQLPDEVGQLKGLDWVNCYNNKFNAFPKVLYDIEGLETLWFSDKVPDIKDAFLGFKSLKTLKLSVKNNGIGELPSLKTLSLCRVPDVTRYFSPSLESLHLSDEKLKKIPKEIARLKSLKVLNWPSEANEIDEALYSLTTLEELDLHQLNVKSFSEKLGELKNLKRLGLRGAWIESLPESIGQLSQLEELDICFNRNLTTLPESCYVLKNLKRLYIEYSPIAKMAKEITARMPGVKICK